MDDEKALVAGALLDPSNREATPKRNVGSIVRAARKALRLSQTELADRVGYVSQATVSRIERSSTRAAQDAVILTKIAEVLNLPAAVLGLTARQQSESDSTVDDVRGREFLSGAAAVTAAALLPRGIIAAAGIGQSDVAEAWRALSRLFELDDFQGGAQVHHVAGAMAGKLGSAVRAGSFAPTVGDDLRAVTATTMELAGWLAFDAGQGTVARSWWLETIHLARDVGNVPDAYTAALASMSLHASTDQELTREVPQLAQAARRAAGDAPGSTLLSVLSAREAVGHAQAGDRVAARKALTVSRQQLEHEPIADDPLWLQFRGPAEFSTHETRVALAFGDHALAEKSARTALSLADEARYPRNPPVYSARLGAVLARSRKFDEAIAVTKDAVKKIDEINGSRRIVAELSKNVAFLPVQQYPPARQFGEAAKSIISGAREE